MDRSPPSSTFLKSLLLMFDGFGLALIFYGIHAIRLNAWDLPSSSFLFSLLAFAAINLFWIYLLNLYHLEPQTPFWLKPLQTLIASFLAGCFIVLISYSIGAVEFSGLIGRGVLITSQIVFAFWAASHRLFLSKWLRKVSERARWIVLGSPEIITTFFDDVAKSGVPGAFSILCPAEGFKVPQTTNATLARSGEWNSLSQLAREKWSGVIVATGNSIPDDVLEELMNLRMRGVKIYSLPDFYEEAWYKVPVFYLERSWFAMSKGFQLLHNPIGLRAKRVFDVIGAIFLLVLTSPILLLTAIAIKLESRGPVLFKQIRVGENESLFTVYKLRSMRNDAEKDGAQWASAKDARVTRIGAFIRKVRIDELPQLFNVIKGDMSFIGPRPERPEFTRELEDQIPFYAMRHILKPGVTGWAQVMYPYGASVADAREKLQFDLYYIKNYSLILDAAIIIKTIRVVLFGQGR